MQPNVLKTTLADWTATEDDLPSLYENTRQRAGRKKRRKNKEQDVHVQNWDDIYDPSRPNVYEEYKHSDERLREIRDWKDRLYAGRRARQMRRGSDQSSDDGKIYKLAKGMCLPLPCLPLPCRWASNTC